MDLLHGNIKTMYFRLLTAAIGSAMVASVFALVDAMMVGRYHGPVGTAALAVFNPMWTIVYSLGILAGIGASVLFAHLRGMGQERTSNEYFTVSVVLGAVLTAAVFAFPNVFVELFMAPTEAVLAIAPAILRAYGVSFLLLPFNIFATYYFQAVLKPGVAMVASLGRGAVVSGALILVLPVVLGPGALWYAMLLTEVVVLLFSAWQMARLERRA